MKKEALTRENTQWGEVFYDYCGLWKSAGLEIKTEKMLGSYQGDIVALLYDPETKLWAYGHTGYGSCPGCDAYQACEDSINEIEELRDSLVDGLIWNNAAAMLAWLKEKDWGQEYFSENDGDFKEWLNNSIETLEKEESC